MSAGKQAQMVRKAPEKPVADRMGDARVVAIIPAYNEDRTLGSVLLKLRDYVDEVIVVDDGSEDLTALVARNGGAFVVQHQSNQGKGAALNSGLAAARERQPDAAVLLDADGQHLTVELEALLAPVLSGEADVALGSRYLNGGIGVPRHRAWGHWAFNWFTRLASGVPASDSQSGYRALSPRALEALSFASKGFSVESEMQFLVREHNLRLVEVPVTIRYPEAPKRNVIQHGLLVLDGLLRLTGQYRPLLFFGLPGFVILLIGLGWGVWVVDIFSRTRQLAVGYAMISVLLSLVGMIGLSTGVILHSVRGLILETMDRIKKQR